MVSEPDLMSEQSLHLYEQSIAMQVKAALMESGYAIEELTVEVEEDGTVSRVQIVFGDTVGDIGVLEQYFHEIFGQEVVIQYEGNR